MKLSGIISKEIQNLHLSLFLFFFPLYFSSPKVRSLKIIVNVRYIS